MFWGHGGFMPPNVFEISRELVKKSAMLQENWPEYFS